MVEWSFQTTSAKGVQSLWTATIITQTQQNARRDSTLRMEVRGAIKALRQQGLGIRAIARQVGCAPSTVTNELRRGTPARRSTRGRAPGYSPNLGKAVYEANRAVCHRQPKAERCRSFIRWVGRQIRGHKWGGGQKVGQVTRKGPTYACTQECSNRPETA